MTIAVTLAVSHEIVDAAAAGCCSAAATVLRLANTKNAVPRGARRLRQRQLRRLKHA